MGGGGGVLTTDNCEDWVEGFEASDFAGADFSLSSLPNWSEMRQKRYM